MDDATSEIYYAQLVGQESTVTVMAALREVIELRGIFCALYSDRGSHFWLTPKAGGAVDRQQLTQVGRAMRELRIQMIAAYSPEARGRSERSFGTWQGRLPQELRLAGITTVEAANLFLRERYIAEFNGRFTQRAAGAGSAFIPLRGQQLDEVCSIQQERVVNRDNTVQLGELALQIEPVRWRGTLAGCRVLAWQHLNGEISLAYGPHLLGRYSAQGELLLPQRAVEKPRRGKAKTPDFPPRLGIAPTMRDSHFPTASAAAGLY